MYNIRFSYTTIKYKFSKLILHHIHNNKYIIINNSVNNRKYQE